MTVVDPYDEVPYKCLPIEWTAPERLALTSLLHGGPRHPLDRYRVLELGCGDGANLLPMAYYRAHATFVGVDGARSQVERAKACRSELGLSNLEFIHADFINADDRLDGQFDFVIGHGIFSWVPQAARNAVLQLCARRLRPGGLLYLNYNANPGWKVRRMVRDLLLAQTAGAKSLGLRAQSAQDVASKIVAALPQDDHAWSKLMANEFKFVCDNDISYIAHEYLAKDNHSFWRSEFMSLVGLHGFDFVADADFNYSWDRISEEAPTRLVRDQIKGHTVEDTVDLLCYRQLHSPILTTRPFARRSPDLDELASLFVASCVAPCEPSTTGHPMFQHPSGYRIEAKETVVKDAFEKLQTIWPRGLRVSALFPDVSQVIDDVLLLHRNGLVELRCVEACDSDARSEPLTRWETEKAGYLTTPYHTRISAVA